MSTSKIYQQSLAEAGSKTRPPMLERGNVNSGSVEKDTHVYDLCALETLARNAYDEAAKQQRFAQKVQQQNMTLTSQIEMYKERNRVLENITKDNNYLKEFLEADRRAYVSKIQSTKHSLCYFCMCTLSSTTYGQTPQRGQTDSGFELNAYAHADHAGCKDDCKSTSGGVQFLGGKLV
ncbi:hypothetical protein Tco_0057288, partial [Tanacetum coccineum]